VTTTDAPPQWAQSLAQHRAGLRKLLRSLLEEEAGRPMWALDALLAVIPADERGCYLAALRQADAEGDETGPLSIDVTIDLIVFVYDQHISAAYAYGPLNGADPVDQHADEILAALAGIPVVTVTMPAGAS
jgi:hypothetical protein